MKQSSFDATISFLDAETSALDVETSAFGAGCSDVDDRAEVIRCGDVVARRNDVGGRAELPAISVRSYRRYWCGISGYIGDCGVGITPQMCNRITNHGDMSTFSKPGSMYIDVRSL